MNNDSWKIYKNNVVLLIITSLILILYFLSLELIDDYFDSSIILFFIIVFFLFYAIISMSRFRCPQCRMYFFRSSGMVAIFVKKCPNCGLFKWPVSADHTSGKNKDTSIYFSDSMINAIISISIILILISSTFCIFDLQPKIIVHKVMNDNLYNIIITSKAYPIRIVHDRRVFAEIWFNGNKVNTRFISDISTVHGYDERIKDISILSASHEIQVVFFHPEHSKSRTGIDLYKLHKE